MTVLAAAQVVTPAGVLAPGVVEVADGRIVAVGPTTGVVPDRVLVPGLVDIQVNGIDDVDVATAVGADWDRLDAMLVAQGVTAWCPTLVTSPLAAYAAPLARIAAAATRAGARPAILGAHLEGPFLGERLGAHRPAFVCAPDLGWIADLPPIVRLMTIGPEVAGALDAIEALASRGITVSIGHSAADLDTARGAVDAGARLVTHAFNAMSGLDHRNPGMVGALLTDDRVAVSVIADLVHVHPRAIEVLFRCKPAGRTVLVTDAVAWRGGRVGPVHLDFDGSAPRLPDGTLAGSALTLDRAVANLVHEVGVDLATAVLAASGTPADLLGAADRGVLEAGRRADVVALDPRSLRCVTTWIGGEQVHG